MSDLLANPAVQSGAIPFVAALIVAALLSRIGPAWAGLCAVAGFAAGVYLTIGFNFDPLTSTRKIILLTLCGAAVGLLLDFLQPLKKAVTLLFFVLGAAAALWVTWTAVARMAMPAALFTGGGLALYAGWVALCFARLPEQSWRIGSAGLTLGLGIGLTSLIGASAFYGQLGSSVAAVSGALLLWRLIANQPQRGSYSFALTVAMPLGLIGAGAAVYAKLPWPALILLALVPVSALIPLPERWNLWLRTVVLTLIGLVPAVLAMLYVWRTAGPVPL
jgi:hypothetical protein